MPKEAVKDETVLDCAYRGRPPQESAKMDTLQYLLQAPDSDMPAPLVLIYLGYL